MSFLEYFTSIKESVLSVFKHTEQKRITPLAFTL